MSNKILISAYYEVACVASVSNRVIARKLEREHSFFFFALVPTFSTNSRGNAATQANYEEGVRGHTITAKKLTKSMNSEENIKGKSLLFILLIEKKSKNNDI